MLVKYCVYHNTNGVFFLFFFFCVSPVYFQTIIKCPEVKIHIKAQISTQERKASVPTMYSVEHQQVQESGASYAPWPKLSSR